MTRPSPATDWHQNLAAGAPGIALARLTAARAVSLPASNAHASIKSMLSAPVTANEQAGLFYGAPALAFVLHNADHSVYAPLLSTLDEHINTLTARKLTAAYDRMDRGDLTAPSEYDLISGLAGLGVYHLLRHGTAGTGMTREILDYLVARAEPVHAHGEAVPGYWCGTGPAGTADPAFPQGHLNLGMAHGVSGVISLLSGAMIQGIEVTHQAKTIAELCALLDRHRRRSQTGDWWPPSISFEEHAVAATDIGSQPRPSWCYGTPGHARAQQLAGIALNDPERTRTAELALAAGAVDPAVTGQFLDASLCHGWAGLVQALHRAKKDSTNPEPLNAALSTAQRGLEDHLVRFGPPVGNGLLDGTCGINLVAEGPPGSGAHSPPPWDACLMLAF